jgi:hypothetical protein
MKRMIGVVMATVLLAGASAAQMVDETKATVKPVEFKLVETPYVIEFKVTGQRIDMGEKYAYAVPLGATISWSCPWPFAVQFEWDAPLDAVYRHGKLLQMKVRPDAVPNRCYKYVIAVYKDGAVLSIDPVIIFYPPEKDRKG